MIPGELVLILCPAFYIIGHLVGVVEGRRRYAKQLRHAARHAAHDQIALAALERAVSERREEDTPYGSRTWW